ncbi:hypothetical protein FPQ18DRAFT_305361 [Pyronema domesticum]|uniref:Uncharacterized protein n=1 Tax=Pyronema omphalodes (strain CBS 100304) TaxID=1076935 RepID=U4LTJ1_PYROM|nr:hypothetical protein FPQ18DRAFT_305361 [Pyronema domesticum]CCX30831.1 Protein of unknown function [Pyronema omphalodes CBS 100304]
MHLPLAITTREVLTIADGTNKTILDLSGCSHDPVTSVITGHCGDRFGAPPAAPTDESNATTKDKVMYAAATGAVLLLAIGIALCLWYFWRRFFQSRFAEFRKKAKLMDGRGGERGRSVELSALGAVPSQASLAPLTQRT